MFIKFTKTIITSLIIVNLGGCSPNKNKKLIDYSELDQDLAGVAMSDGLRRDYLVNDCNLDDAEPASEPEFSKNVEKVPAFWSRCQMLYTCSPSSNKKIREWFAPSVRFNLGFAAFKDFKSREITPDTRGLFRPGTENIYLDSRMTNTFEACSVLMHELTHRFDPSVESGDHSFGVEYRAYYNQTAFAGEIEFDNGPLGIIARAGGMERNIDRKKLATALPQKRITSYLYTRAQLFKLVSDKTGKEADPSIIDQYAPFAWE